MMDGFLDYLTGHVVLALYLILYEFKPVVVWVVRSGLLVDGGEVHSSSYETFACTDEQCGAMHCCVVGWSFSSMDVCHTLLDEDSGVPEGNKQHWWCPIMANTWPTLFLHHLFKKKKKHLQWSYALRALLWLFLWGEQLCHSMHRHFVSKSKWWNQLSSHVAVLWRKSSPLTAYLSTVVR